MCVETFGCFLTSGYMFPYVSSKKQKLDRQMTESQFNVGLNKIWTEFHQTSQTKIVYLPE